MQSRHPIIHRVEAPELAAAYLRRTGCSGDPAGSPDCRTPALGKDSRRWPRKWSWWDCTGSHWSDCTNWSPRRPMPSSTCPSRPYMTRRQRNLGKNTPFYTFEKARLRLKAALPWKKNETEAPKKWVWRKKKQIKINLRKTRGWVWWLVWFGLVGRGLDGEKMFTAQRLLQNWPPL